MIPKNETSWAYQSTIPLDEQFPETASLTDISRQATAEVNPGWDMVSPELEDQLVQARLGMASSLFTALRAKHAPTAAHCLRVAIGVSAWSHEIGLCESQRNSLEVAALLHDIGKIGVPDHVLLKPGPLTSQETLVMNGHRKMGLEILGSFCSSREILEIVQYAPARYDDSQSGYDRTGKDLPRGARILAIVDAFDAMMTDHVYRPALSQERAMAELYKFSGSQFDPDLVTQFSTIHAKEPGEISARALSFWLEENGGSQADEQWRLGVSQRPVGEPATPDDLFHGRLLNSMSDGVVFVDSQRQIFLWNRGMERLSGITGSAVYRRYWTPNLVNMMGEKNQPISDQDCPVVEALETGSSSRRRLKMAGRNGCQAPVDLQVTPVLDANSALVGATLHLRDASQESTLEARCQSLHDRATKDPLTKVANRAEFDRMYSLFISAHLESNLPCSLIIGDIDDFKKINDLYGHQAGDEAIKGFADLLKSLCQTGDLVARYGGEEFVILCTDENNAAAARRAEKIRRDLSKFPQPMLGGRRMTASFGVTEYQSGDTPGTMFRRADRALLQAKEMGRNMVIQLGTGMTRENRPRRWWPFCRSAATQMLETHLVTIVPIDVALEKLRGFVADHDARVTSSGTHHLNITLAGYGMPRPRRRGDRTATWIIEVKLSANHSVATDSPNVIPLQPGQTKIDVVIRPQHLRERRRDLSTVGARQVLTSLKSYLMAHEGTGRTTGKLLQRVTAAVIGKLKKQPVECMSQSSTSGKEKLSAGKPFDPAGRSLGS